MDRRKAALKAGFSILTPAILNGCITLPRNLACRLPTSDSPTWHKPTLFFCDELIRLYGGDDYQVSQAASYAVENWAAAGFWGQLIKGFHLFNERNGTNLPLGFFIWHDQLECQHAAHTQEELEELYFTPRTR